MLNASSTSYCDTGIYSLYNTKQGIGKENDEW